MGHARIVVVACGLLLLGLVAGPVAAADPPTSFSDDFSALLGDRWEIHGGEWAIVGGRLQGLGTTPDRLHVDDPSALDLAAAIAIVDGLSATNATVCLEMTPLERVDMGIVLRWRGPGDGIWLGLRALGDESDLTGSQAIAGVPTLYTPSHSVLIPAHEVGATLDVCATLVDQRLVVDVDGTRVIDRTFPFVVRAGSIGVHALEANLVAYDDVRVTVTPPIPDTAMAVPGATGGQRGPAPLALVTAAAFLPLALWLRRRWGGPT
jgi:hypothetical protein